MKKHKHYDLILEWAAGAPIEFRFNSSDFWKDIVTPVWSENIEYRVVCPIYPCVMDSTTTSLRVFFTGHKQGYVVVTDIEHQRLNEYSNDWDMRCFRVI